MARCLIVDDSLNSLIESIKKNLLPERADYNDKIIKGFIASYLDVNDIGDHSELKESDIKAITDKINRGKINRVMPLSGYRLPEAALELVTSKYGLGSTKIFKLDNDKQIFNERGLLDFIDEYVTKAGYVIEQQNSDAYVEAMMAFGMPTETGTSEISSTTYTLKEGTKVVIPVPIIPFKYEKDSIQSYIRSLTKAVNAKFPNINKKDITFNISITNASTLALATLMTQEGYTVDISVTDNTSSKFSGISVLQTLMEEGLLVDTSVIETLTADMLTYDIISKGKESYISLSASNMSELSQLSSTLEVDILTPLSSPYAITQFAKRNKDSLILKENKESGNKEYHFYINGDTYVFNAVSINSGDTIQRYTINKDELFDKYLEDYYRKILSNLQDSGKSSIILDSNSLLGLSLEKSNNILKDFPSLDIIKLGNTLPSVQRAKYNEGKSYSTSMSQVKIEQSLGSLIPSNLRKDLEKAVVQLLAFDIQKKLQNIEHIIDSNESYTEEQKELLKEKIREVKSKNEEVTVRSLLKIKGLFSIKEYKESITTVISTMLQDFEGKEDKSTSYIYKTVRKSLERVPNALSEVNYLEYANKRYAILKALYDHNKIEELLSSMLSTKSINSLTNETINTTPEESNKEEDVSEEEQREEAVKESFGVDHFASDSMSSVTSYIRTIISTVPITDSNGNYKISESGFIEKYNDREVFNILLDNLYHATSSDKMMELLENMKTTYPWVNTLVSIIKNEMEESSNNPSVNNNPRYSKTKAALFKAVRKNKVKYIKSRGHLGKIVLNNESATNVPLNIWKNEVLSGVSFSSSPLYDSQGNLSMVYYEKVEAWLISIKKKFNDGEYKDKQTGRLNSKKLAVDLISIFKSAGISYYSVDTLSKILSTIDAKNFADNSKYLHNKNEDITKLLNLFTGFLNDVSRKFRDISSNEKKGKDTSEDRSFSSSFSSNMLKVFKLLENYSHRTALKPSFRVGAKLRSTFATPNYIGDLMMELRGEGGITKRQLLDIIHKRFSTDLFHYRDGQYVGWVKYIVDNINSKYLKDSDIVSPEESIIDRFHFLANEANEDWDSMVREEKLLHNISLFSSEVAFTGKGFALLEVPNYSDAGKVDYIRFPLFLDQERGGYKSYYSEIADSIHSEFLRVNILKNHRRDLSHIKNSKKLYAETGNSFIYFSALNSVKAVKDSEGNYNILPLEKAEEGFYTTYNKLFSEGNTAELSKLVQAASRFIVQSNLEEFLNELESDPISDKSSKYNKGLRSAGFALSGDSTKRMIAALNTLLSIKELSNYKHLIEDIKSNVVEGKLVNYYRAIRVLEEVITNDFQNGGLNVEDSSDIFEAINELKEAIHSNSNLNMVKTYIANYTLGLFNIINMTSNDIAAYDNYVEFQKRNKQVHSPYNRLDTSAMSSENQRHVIIEDIVEASTTIEDVKTLLESSDTVISTIDSNTKKIILKALESIKVTDGQSYRSLDSYKEIMMGAGAWTPELNRAYYKIKNYKENKKKLSEAKSEEDRRKILRNLPSSQERNMFFQAIKPYTFTHTHLGEFTASNKQKYDLSVGEQHKNSESPILLMLEIFPDEMDKVFEGTLFKVISDVMRFSKETNAPIDVIHTRGAVKVGTTVRTLNLQQLKEDKGKEEGGDRSLANYIYKILYGENKTMNTSYIGSTPWSDYGIQVETPEHFLDHTMNLGTQISKLIFIDNDPNALFSLNISGNSKLKLTSSELYKIFNAIIFKNHLIKSNKVTDDLGSIQKLREILVRDIANNPDKYNRELEKALDVITDSEGNMKFRRPLNDPISYKRISNLIGSYFRTNLASHNVFGGTGILLSPFGFEKKVKMVYNKDGSLKHVEAIVPVYDQRLIEIYGNSEGIIDEAGIKRMEQDDPKMLQLIGYRIPTENKYSTVPIKIVGFIPSYLGNAVVLPSDYIELAGWDFDVDKLYMFRYGLKQSLIADYEGNKRKYLFTKSINTSGISTSEDLTDSIIDGETDIDAMNNLILDIFQSIMKNPNTLDKMIIPGGFSNLVDLSKYTDVLINLTSLYKNNPSFRSNTDDTSVKIILERLISGETPSNVKALISMEGNDVNPLSPLSATKFSHANKVGKDMIAVMAAAVAEHAVTQQGTFVNNTSISFNGRTFNSFHKVYTVGREIKDTKDISAEEAYQQYLRDNADKLHSNVNYVSKVLSSILAAAADNAKQPVLYLLGINLDVASTFVSMIKLGYTIEEVTIMFLNPAVIANYTGQRSRINYISNIADVARKVLENNNVSISELFNSEPSNDLGYDTKTKKENGKEVYIPTPSIRGTVTAMTTLSKLEAGMLNPNDIKNALDIVKANMYFTISANHYDSLSKSLRVGQSALSSLRLDKTSKSAPTTTFEALSTLLSYRRIYSNIKGYSNGEPSSYIEDGVIINPKITKDNYVKRIKDNPTSMTYMQTKFSMVLQPYIEFMSKHFPEMSEGGINIAEYLFNNYNTGNTIDPSFLEDFFTDMISYYLSNIPSYKSDSNTTSKEKRMYVLKDFPNRFADIKSKIESNYPELSNNAVFRYLYITKNRTGNIRFIRTNDTAMSISNEAQNDFISGIEQLASSEKEELRTFARMLVDYAYYRGGFSFGNNNYSHLLPFDVLTTIEGYSEALANMRRDIESSKDNIHPNVLRFIDQYFSHKQNKEGTFIDFAELSSDNEEGVSSLPYGARMYSSEGFKVNKTDAAPYSIEIQKKYIDHSGNERNTYAYDKVITTTHTKDLDKTKGTKKRVRITTENINMDGETVKVDNYYRLASETEASLIYIKESTLGYPGIAIQYDMNLDITSTTSEFYSPSVMVKTQFEQLANVIENKEKIKGVIDTALIDFDNIKDNDNNLCKQ